MADLPNPQSCDICGAIKGKNNHWWRVWIDEYNIVMIAPWARMPKSAHSHACGEEHAVRLAGKLVNEIARADHAPEAERLPEFKPT
jgi:hypothetical protein